MNYKLSKIAIVFIFFLTTARTFAHGGEQHDDNKQKAAVTASYFSTENSSELYEVLLKYGELNTKEDAHITLFLSDVNTNRPISNAILVLSNPDDDKQQIEVKIKENGVYELHTKFKDEKTHSFNISINGSLGADLIQVSNIEIGKKLPKPVEIEASTTTSFFSLGNIIPIVITLFIGLFLGLFLKRNSKIGKKAISLFLILLLTISPASNFNANAHGGEDHEENRKNNNGDGSSQILIPKETQFLFDVTTQKIETGNFTPSINLFGTLLPTSSGKAVIQTPQTGTIKSLNVLVGQIVTKGQLLAIIEQNIDANTKVSWLTQKNSLEAELNLAKKEYDRLKSIADIVAKRDIDEAERRYKTASDNIELFKKSNSSGSNNNFQLIPLYSPINGKVDNFNFSIGATVNIGQDIFTVTNLSSLYVEAQVFDKDAEAVKNGKEFLVECTDRHRTQNIKLLTMAQSINPTNQSQKVLFEMDNENGDFKIGEFVNIRVFNEVNTKNIAVPNSAITEINGKSAVFIKDAAEKYTLSYVSLGENNGQFTTIIKGVEEGEKIVINATYQLKMMYLNQ